MSTLEIVATIIAFIAIAFTATGVFIYELQSDRKKEEKKHMEEFYKAISKLKEEWNQEDSEKYGDKNKKWVKSY